MPTKNIETTAMKVNLGNFIALKNVMDTGAEIPAAHLQCNTDEANQRPKAPRDAHRQNPIGFQSTKYQIGNDNGAENERQKRGRKIG